MGTRNENSIKSFASPADQKPKYQIKKETRQEMPTFFRNIATGKKNGS
jgi:hypothetical protein